MSKARLRTYRTAACAALAFVLAGCTPTKHASAPQSASAASHSARSDSPARGSTATGRTRAGQYRPAAARADAHPAGGEGLRQRTEADYRKGDLLASQGRVRSRRRPHALQRHRHQIAIQQLQDEFDHIVDARQRPRDGSAQAGQRLCAQRRAHARRRGQRRDLRRRSQPRGQSQSELATTKSDLPLMVNEYVGRHSSTFSPIRRRATTHCCTPSSAPAATRR